MECNFLNATQTQYPLPRYRERGNDTSEQEGPETMRSLCWSKLPSFVTIFSKHSPSCALDGSDPREKIEKGVLVGRRALCRSILFLFFFSFFFDRPYASRPCVKYRIVLRIHGPGRVQNPSRHRCKSTRARPIRELLPRYSPYPLGFVNRACTGSIRAFWGLLVPAPRSDKCSFVYGTTKVYPNGGIRQQFREQFSNRHRSFLRLPIRRIVDPSRSEVFAPKNWERSTQRLKLYK